jgi:hypothetical protein
MNVYEGTSGRSLQSKAVAPVRYVTSARVSTLYIDLENQKRGIPHHSIRIDLIVINHGSTVHTEHFPKTLSAIISLNGRASLE